MNIKQDLLKPNSVTLEIGLVNEALTTYHVGLAVIGLIQILTEVTKVRQQHYK